MTSQSELKKYFIPTMFVTVHAKMSIEAASVAVDVTYGLLKVDFDIMASNEVMRSPLLQLPRYS